MLLALLAQQASLLQPHGRSSWRPGESSVAVQADVEPGSAPSWSPLGPLPLAPVPRAPRESSAPSRDLHASPLLGKTRPAAPDARVASSGPGQPPKPLASQSTPGRCALHLPSDTLCPVLVAWLSRFSTPSSLSPSLPSSLHLLILTTSSFKF